MINLQFFGGRGAGSSGGASAGGSSRFNNSSGVMDFLQGELDKFGLGISKERLAEQVYRAANSEGANISILNGKYLSVTNSNGTAEFSFTKSNREGKWVLTPMLSYGDVTTGRHNGVSMYRAAGQWFSNKADAERAAVKKKLG